MDWIEDPNRPNRYLKQCGARAPCTPASSNVRPTKLLSKPARKLLEFLVGPLPVATDDGGIVTGARARALLATLFGMSCALSLAGCGGAAAELLAKLITARFVPNQTTVAAGSTRTVELEVTCSNAGMGTPFGRLKLDVSLARGGNLPSGVTAALVGGELPYPPLPGYLRFACTDPHPDPALRMAHIPVQITVAPGTDAQALSLLAYVEIERMHIDEPSRTPPPPHSTWPCPPRPRRTAARTFC